MVLPVNPLSLFLFCSVLFWEFVDLVSLCSTDVCHCIPLFPPFCVVVVVVIVVGLLQLIFQVTF